MNLGRVTGTVVATRKYPALEGIKLLLVQPTDFGGKDRGEPLVACDTVRAGYGDVVFFVKSREAALSLDKKFNPSDASIMGIVDEITYRKDDRIKN